MVSLPERGPQNIPVEKVPVVEVGNFPSETQATRENLVQIVQETAPTVSSGGQIIMTSPAPQQPKIVLPMTQGSYANPQNWHLPVTVAISWLLRWIERLRKMYPDRTVFNE